MHLIAFADQSSGPSELERPRSGTLSARRFGCRLSGSVSGSEDRFLTSDCVLSLPTRVFFGKLDQHCPKNDESGRLRSLLSRDCTMT